jgi:hypothetical protein
MLRAVRPDGRASMGRNGSADADGDLTEAGMSLDQRSGWRLTVSCGTPAGDVVERTVVLP